MDRNKKLKRDATRLSIDNGKSILGESSIDVAFVEVEGGCTLRMEHGHEG